MARTWMGLLITLLCSGAYGGSLSHYVSGRSCESKYEFDYPSDWQVSPLPDHQRSICRVQITLKDLSKRLAEDNLPNGYTVVVSVFNGTLLQAADVDGFDFYKGKWAIRGRQGRRDESVVISTDRWSGVKGEATVGCSPAQPIENGIGVAACEEYRAVLQDEYDRIWTLRGNVGTNDVFETVLSSFKFLGE